MYELEVESGFSAAHRLRGYAGDCACLHGHNWGVRAVVRAEKVDGMGIAVDFRRIKEALADILASFDHKDLNSLPEFAEENPTSEALARLLHRRLSARLDAPGVRVARVAVRESNSCEAAYFE